MAESLGELLVRLGLDGVPLENGANKAGKSLSTLESKMQKAVVRGTILAEAMMKVAKSLASMVPDALEAIDSQAKLARSMGGTVAATDALQTALGDAGVDASKFEQAMRFMNRALGDAIVKGGPAAEAFTRIGLSARDLTQLDLDERFSRIADAISQLGTAQERASAASDIFGAKAGTDLVNAIDAGGSAVRDMRKELESYGVLLSEIDATKVEVAGDALARIGKILNGVLNRVVVKLAPYLEVIAERFKDVAAETHGFQSALDTAFEVALRGAGFLGDAMRGFQVIFKGAELIAQGFAATLVSVFQLAANAVAMAIDSQIESLNRWIRAANLLPGVDIGEVEFRAKSSVFIESLNSMSDEARTAVGTIRDELHALAMEPLPSEAIKAFLSDVEDAANQAAAAMVAAQSGKNVGVTTGETDEEKKKREAQENAAEEAAQREAERQARMEQQYMEHLQRQVDILTEYNATDLENKMAKYEEDLLLLQIARGNEILTEEEYRAQIEALELAHQARLKSTRIQSWNDFKNLSKLGWQQQAQIMTSSLAQMTAATARENRAMFEVNKAAAIANAAINTFQMAVSAYNAMSGIPYVGPFLGAAAAAAATAFGLAQVSAISSQSFGSGAAPSVGGASAATPVSPTGGTAAGPAAPSQSLSVEGLDPNQLFTGKAVQQIAEQLVQFQKDGGQVVFA